MIYMAIFSEITEKKMHTMHGYLSLSALKTDNPHSGTLYISTSCSVLSDAGYKIQKNMLKTYKMCKV